MRHKLLAYLETMIETAKPPDELVETDETYVTESQKGVKCKNRKPRKHGESASKRGLSNEQYCICVVTDRNKNVFAKCVNRAKPSSEDIIKALSAHVSRKSVLLCDGELEKERYACLRLRFTKPDENGEIKQYIAECEPENIVEKDLTGMTMKEADDTMQHWAYETFDGDDIPMCEFRIVKLPDNYTGFFVHMDHRLNDSVGVAVMATDIMNLYKHLKFGEDYPY